MVIFYMPTMCRESNIHICRQLSIVFKMLTCEANQIAYYCLSDHSNANTVNIMTTLTYRLAVSNMFCVLFTDDRKFFPLLFFLQQKCETYTVYLAITE